MLESVQQLLKRYQAFYEVSPYHVVVEEGHGSASVTRRIVNAGFDVDLHAISNKREVELPPPDEYALGYAGIKKLADTVSQKANESYIEVISFPATVFSEARDQFRSEAVVRIRISPRRGVDQPSGIPERNALREIEEQLQALGVRRR